MSTIKPSITWNFFPKRRISLVHIVGVEHLMPFIPSQVESFLQVDITQIVKVDDSSESDLVIRLLAFDQIDSLAFFFGRWVSKPGRMDKHVFG